MSDLRIIPSGNPARPYALIDVLRHSVLIDTFRTLSGASHAARLLERGLAHVERHQVIGCRVQPERVPVSA